MPSVPGFDRNPGEMPQSGCGTLLIGALVGLAFAAAMLWLAIYATNLVESGFNR
ncbi:MAG: hypothetical protein ABFC77_08780 [Thermoguttaceae bacterium]